MCRLSGFSIFYLQIRFLLFILSLLLCAERLLFRIRTVPPLFQVENEAAMLSLNHPKPFSSVLFHHNQQPHPSSLFNLLINNLHRTKNNPKPRFKPISSTLLPSTPPPSSTPQQVYQPFRPPPSPLPSKFRSLDTDKHIEILANRLGLWFEYAPLIPCLIQQGFTHSSIEELTGISGVEQNRLVVAAQVRESLLQSQSTIDPDTLSFFETCGAELLYEIRLVNAAQRASAARYIVHNGFDAKSAQDLARAIKDFPRRRGDPGWESFNYSVPGDCLSFMYFRQSREYPNPSDWRTLALERALEVAETENARNRVLEELRGKGGGGDAGKEGEIGAVKVPVVRMRFGEVAEATSVVVLPVCAAEEGTAAVVAAPEECRSQGEFGVVVAEKGWKRWVVLPLWEPLVGIGRGVAVAFGDARVLPWKVNRWYKEEAILVVVDREKRNVEEKDGFYLTADASKLGEEESAFKVERGTRLTELGAEECLGTVVLVVRPPKEELDDQLSDEDWE